MSHKCNTLSLNKFGDNMIGQLLTVAGEEVSYGMSRLRYQLANATIPRAKVLVNGSPKSGTTWMLKMIASIPGYRDVGNFDGVFEKYHTVKAGDVVHGHDWYVPELKTILLQEGIKVVLMIRDPRDQLVSRMFHIKRSPVHKWHERMKGLSNDEALMMCIEGREGGLPGTDRMIKLAQTWIEGNADTLFIKYEELLADPLTHFKQVLAYLGIPDKTNLADTIVERNRFERLSAGKRIWQTRKPGEEKKDSHFRKGITGDWKNYLTPAHIQRFKEVAGEQLIQLGYEQDLNW